MEITVLETWRHYGFQSVQLVDLTGDRIPDLAIKSDSGDGVQTSSHLYVYATSEGHFRQLFTTPTRWHSEPEEGQAAIQITTQIATQITSDDTVWTQAIDIPRTLRERGQRCCFEKTVYADSGRWFAIPKVSRPCDVPKAEG